MKLTNTLLPGAALALALSLCVAGFSDATRDVWMTRIVAWRLRIAQAGNRGVGLGGPFVAMGIWAVGLPRIRSDRPVDRGLLG
jgi:hypothetical protein